MEQRAQQSPAGGVEQVRALHYDYERQCYARAGVVMACGHLVGVGRYAGCYSCQHAGEAHVCTAGCRR